jgi:hypothetical protein
MPAAKSRVKTKKKSPSRSLTPEHILQLGLGFWGSKTLLSAVPLPSGGTCIVFEELIDDERKKNAFALLMSLNILIETPGGFNCTGADYLTWMHEAGFRKTYVEPLVGPASMVVASK